jgi:hypothetical protein
MKTKTYVRSVELDGNSTCGCGEPAKRNVKVYVKEDGYTDYREQDYGDLCPECVLDVLGALDGLVDLVVVREHATVVVSTNPSKRQLHGVKTYDKDDPANPYE